MSWYTEHQLLNDMEMMGREMEYVRENLLILEDEMKFLEGELDNANAALKAAWGLMSGEQRLLLLENDYAEELFWKSPERKRRDFDV
jgi:predicted mannosyl-3-phosphoglycerate phosphatase (HAD superfamily)